jgi:hypothetical protein
MQPDAVQYAPILRESIAAFVSSKV